MLLPVVALLAVASTNAPDQDNVALRDAAQKGLGWLARAAAQWTQEQNCFGCHVQAVTLEALAVGKHNQFDVKPQQINSMVRALRMGVTAGGYKTGIAFQGAAWARYDQWIDEAQTQQLMKYARELLHYQRKDGSVEDDDRRPPVVAGTMQTTFQAMQTWRQAYARTADEMWLGPMRRAEAYLSKRSAAWASDQDRAITDLNYALMGLVAAGVHGAEPSAQKLSKSLLGRQHEDGGWGLWGKNSDAFATGQTLYALKLTGMSDHDEAIERGMRWLVRHQKQDGSWHTVQSEQKGADKGEAMWAVLGLVTVDVMSIVAEGIEDGQHLRDVVEVFALAKDNQENGIESIDMSVDDVRIARTPGAKLSFAWNTRSLGEGKHLVDISATNAKGQVARRRFEVYAGNVFMTHVGVQFDEKKNVSEATLRNIAPDADRPGTIRFEVFTLDKEGNAAKKIFTTEEKGELGAMRLVWNGDGAARGRYIGELSFVDGDRVLQKETVVFFHDTASVQHEKFGEVEGKITLRGGTALSANTLIELVDAQGRVVQQTRSTEQGNYRFKNVEGGDYKVRFKKDGFATKEASVAPAALRAPASANVDL